MSRNPYTSGKALVVGDETFTLSDAREAIEALKWVRSLGVTEVHPCSWLVQAPPVWASDPDCDWYPDSPSDLIRECGAPAVGHNHGFACLHGHEHDSRVEYYEEEEVAHAMQNGYLVPADARYMDGRGVF